MANDHPELDFEFYIPAGRESFRVFEVANLLRHSKDQIIKLIDQGKFGKVVDCATGRKSSVTIPRAGLVKYLKENSK
jgi:hypothetical protein